MTFGMEISLYISKLKLSGLLCPVMNDVVSVIKHVIISSLEILFNVKALILFFGVV